MTKSELVKALATNKAIAGKGITAAQSKAVVDAALTTIESTLKKGETVTLTGFGTFGVRKRAARTAKNPRTGAPVKVKARVVPYFRAGAGLKATAAKAKVAVG